MSSQNRPDGSMCFKSYIRQTRASEYTFESALAELTDNSIEAGATKIKIYFEMNEEGNLYKVKHWDNGKGIKDPKAIYTQGYMRNREDSGHGCYGKGMKTAVFNIGECIKVYSVNGQEKNIECIFELPIMIRDDTYVPLVRYSENNTNETCTNIEITDILPTLKKINLSLICKQYKHRYKNFKDNIIELYVNGIINKTVKYDKSFEENYTKLHKITTIKIYENNKDKNIIFCNDQNKEICTKNWEINRPNGNTRILPTKKKIDKNNYKLLDDIIFETHCIDDQSVKFSRNENDKNDIIIVDICERGGGMVDIYRKKLSISNIKGISYRAKPNGDGYSNYTRHQLSYHNDKLDSLIGTNHNKQNNGNLNNYPLLCLLQIIQQDHELEPRSIQKKKKEKPEKPSKKASSPKKETKEETKEEKPSKKATLPKKTLSKNLEHTEDVVPTKEVVSPDEVVDFEILYKKLKEEMETIYEEMEKIYEEMEEERKENKKEIERRDDIINYITEKYPDESNINVCKHCGNWFLFNDSDKTVEGDEYWICDKCV